MKTIACFALAFLFAGCVTGPQTASGRPEVRVSVDAKSAKNRIAEAYSSSGFHIESSDDLGLSMTKPLDGLAEAFVGTGNHRVRFNLSESANVTTIRATSFVVAGSVNTETSTGKAGAEIQQSLEQLFAGQMLSAPTMLPAAPQ